jgi:pimeloyl-ACP methyl ester carboxylesterase
MRKFKQHTSVLIIIALMIITIIPISIQATQGGTPTNNDIFSIMQISDTQFLAASYPQLFINTTNWIVSNAVSYNTKMVVHTGDIVDNINGSSGTFSDPQQWSSANSAMSLLQNACIPYCWDAGNHDQIPWNDANGTWLGSSYPAFNTSNMRANSYWVGDLADSKNTAVRFTCKGYDFLIINIEYMASNATLTWMKTLMDSYKNANVIIAAHTYLNKGGGYGFASAGLPGEVAWCTNLRTIIDGYPKVFLTLSGHDPTGTANMTKIGNREEIFFDRQGVNSNTGAAAIRIYTFDLTSMSVNTSTYAYTLSTNSWSWLTDAYNQFNFNIALSSNDWGLTSNGRIIKGCPDLREYVWMKNASMSPNGPYDKIGLHRLVKTGIQTKGAIFVDPGIYGSAEQLLSPTDSNYSIDESSNQLVYWANRGFEVYSIDWRTHFLPSTTNVSQASSIAGNWGWDIFINDMKEAVDKTKDVSGNSKIFLAGISMGGQVAMYYASEYWKQDLKGIIILDGTENPTKANTTNTYNVTVILGALAKTSGLAWDNPRRSSTDIPPSGMLFAYQTALQNPNAPAEWPPGTPLQPTINPLTNKTWTNITEYIAYQMYSTNYSNIYEGYGNITVIVQWRANGDRYYPVRLGVESNAIHDWNNCPYVSFDFDDHYKEIDIPIIAIRSELWGITTLGNFTNGTFNVDFTQITLPKYGHLDVFTGPYSAKDVSEPTYQWMIARTLKASTSAPSATSTIGQSAIFSIAASGGQQPYKYQWYEANTLLPGQTTPMLIIAKNTAGVYTYYCSVTDAIGITTNTTAMTLTVNSQIMPVVTNSDTISPTPQTSPPTSTPTSTPTSSPTPDSTPAITPSATTNSSMLSTTTIYITISAAAIIAVLAITIVLIKRTKK